MAFVSKLYKIWGYHSGDYEGWRSYLNYTMWGLRFSRRWLWRMPHVSKLYNASSDIFTAVTMKNAVFWDVTPCGSCKNRYFGEMYRLHQIVFLRSVRRLLVTVNDVPSSPIFSPWWLTLYVPPKCRFLQEPHGITSQKTKFFQIYKFGRLWWTWKEGIWSQSKYYLEIYPSDSRKAGKYRSRNSDIPGEIRIERHQYITLEKYFHSDSSAWLNSIPVNLSGNIFPHELFHLGLAFGILYDPLLGKPRYALMLWKPGRSSICHLIHGPCFPCISLLPSTHG
jgi:hypothetical protein